VSDDETFAWKLQERHPDVEFVNLGVAGYSTYQSLLRLELALEDADRPPVLVLHAFHRFQAPRNVADVAWLESLAANARRGLVSLPYCSLGADGGLEPHPPVRFPAWPLRDVSAAVRVAQRAYARYLVGGDIEDAPAVTAALLARMARVARTSGADFSLFLLGDQATHHDYVGPLEHGGISVIHCDIQPFPGWVVPGESHPSGAMHTRWADCLDAALADRLR
jgi:hypothetical protein